MNDAIGRLVRVDLREVWKHEAHDFTQWLEHNIDLLNEATGLALTVAGRERAAGAFACDLVAEDAAGGVVIIENQLERSNHDHLGKVITYLSQLGATTAVWIVSEPRPEHVGAMTWLNESSSASFYMVKVEAVRIGDSPAAPMFTQIVGPSPEIKEAAAVKQEVAERYDLRRQWWTALLERAKPRSRMHSHLSPPTAGYMGTSSGVQGLYLNYVVRQEECAAELYIDRGDVETNKRIFDDLHSHRAEITQQFGAELSWERLDNRRASRIAYRSSLGGYRSELEEWPDIQDDIIDAMLRLESALRPHITKYREG